jgi:hypothetical protein
MRCPWYGRRVCITTVVRPGDSINMPVKGISLYWNNSNNINTREHQEGFCIEFRAFHLRIINNYNKVKQKTRISYREGKVESYIDRVKLP